MLTYQSWNDLRCLAPKNSSSYSSSTSDELFVVRELKDAVDVSLASYNSLISESNLSGFMTSSSYDRDNGG